MKGRQASVSIVIISGIDERSPTALKPSGRYTTDHSTFSPERRHKLIAQLRQQIPVLWLGEPVFNTAWAIAAHKSGDMKKLTFISQFRFDNNQSVYHPVFAE
ncbi:hypothetical protein NRB16_18165 [Pseudomonas sp. LJDD11]|uniref:hypothetical protein n=1 Tax=Pseudomonas sp. LJDD11 TaxID=2931984 RepID=UPI00211B7E5A|nr:hypothetical protein [Pseudomonas sp. LJDD11]MCQ9425446.1 hypothetical protein [Pseudomonas sp. LJDD11]